MDSKVKRGRGRPRKDDSGCRLDVMIGPEERKKLEEIAFKMGVSKSEIVRLAIDLLYGFRKDSM